MAIGTFFEITAAGDIRRTGTAHGTAGAEYFSVIDFHRWLQDKADDAVATGDDILDITDTTPSERATDNFVTLLAPYNIDDDASEYLYDGSIVQAGGDEIYDGFVVIAARGMDLQIVQNGLVIVNDFWNTVPFGETDKGLNFDETQGLSHRFMLKVRTAAADINGRRILGQTRVLGFTFSEFAVNGTARGNNVLALQYTSDLNNQTAAGTIATWTDIVNLNQGYIELDVDNNATPEGYYSEWDLGARSKNQFYERLKWATRQASAETLYGLTGELFRGITHEIDVDTVVGLWDETFEAVSWTGGTGQMLAVDDTTPTKMWIQLLTGVIPTDGQVITGAVSTATAAVNVSVQSRPVSTPFVGQSTGSAIIGAYGLGIQTADLTASDLLIDLTNAPRTPPNNVTFTVSGLVNGEDRVLVGPSAGGLLDTDQFTLNGAQNNLGTVTVNEAIPSDTPGSGTLRVFVDGTYQRLVYTSRSGFVFTLSGLSGFSFLNGAFAFISYIDLLAAGASASFTTVYNANRDLFVRARDGGGSPIKTFEAAAAVLSNTGGGVTIIRTPDV